MNGGAIYAKRVGYGEQTPRKIGRRIDPHLSEVILQGIAEVKEFSAPKSSHLLLAGGAS